MVRVAFVVLLVLGFVRAAAAQAPPRLCGPIIPVVVSMKDGRILTGKLWCLDATTVTMAVKVPKGSRQNPFVTESLDVVRRIVEPPPGRKLAIIGGAVVGAFVGSFITDDRWPNVPLAAGGALVGAAEGAAASRQGRIIFEGLP